MEEVPDEKPQMRLILLAEAVRILEAGEEFFRVAHLVDAEFELRHIVSDELDFYAFAGRESACCGERE
jgi:hypothetical protein